mgnify:CR=1 FL=1
MKLHTGKRTLAAALASATLLAGCGSDGGEVAEAPSYEAALERASGSLATHYENGAELIEGGEAAFDERIASLEGTPIVVNEWGSWCGPCRDEFPYFQSQAAERLDQVAFLGVDTEDSPDAYETFIRDNPIPYPSVADPDGEFAKWVDTPLLGVPNTLFFDTEGELVYTHQGPYASEADLAADIDKYALGGRSS